MVTPGAVYSSAPTGRVGSVSRQTTYVVRPDAPAAVKHPPNTDSVRRSPATVVVAIVAAATTAAAHPAHRVLLHPPRDSVTRNTTGKGLGRSVLTTHFTLVTST